MTPRLILFTRKDLDNIYPLGDAGFILVRRGEKGLEGEILIPVLDENTGAVSSEVERTAHNRLVAGSNPARPTLMEE